MIKNIEFPEELMSNTMRSISQNEELANKIKEKFVKHGINYGVTQRIISFYDEEKENLDKRVFILLVKEVYLLSRNGDLNPSNFFEENEIKLAETYDATIYKEEKLSLPFTLENFLMIDDENYLGILDVKFLKKMFTADLIRYNFETQREAKFIKMKGNIQKVANVNPNSVRDISKSLLDGTLSSTQLTFNAAVGTADEGDELTYNPKKMELTINKGTFIDILDGMHRLTGVLSALEINPEIDFRFSIMVKNVNTATAQRYIGEINTVNVMSRAHRDALKASRRSDGVVKQLQLESELKGKISQGNRALTINNEIVTKSTLADTIDEEFQMETRKEANEVGKYLVDFFNTLIDSYPDEFVDKVKETKNDSIINSNFMFAGYVVLARRMKEEGIPLSELTNILDKIDFSRTNEEWENLKILENKNKLNIKRIKKYFTQLKI